MTHRRSPRPALHGDVLLIDSMGATVAFLKIGEDERVSTVGLVVDSVRRGPPRDVVARGRIVRRGNRVIIDNVAVAVADDPTHVVARGRGVYNVARRSG